jgi:tetratricopeptide (TPR) repeat protein
MFRTTLFAILTLATSFAVHGQEAKVKIASIQSLIRSQHYDEALKAAQSALRQSPSDFRLWTLEGIVFSIQGNKNSALAAYEKALSLSPTYSAALKGEVQLLYQSQDARAIQLLQRILKSEPKDETANEMLATLEKNAGNCKAAIQHFVLSANAIGTHPDSLEGYGYCLVQEKQAEKAISVFEQLVALLPTQNYPKYDLAVVLIETKQNEAALKILEPMLLINPSDPDLLSLASEAYEAVGDTPKAVSLLREAIVLNPKNANFYVTFAALCLDHQSFQVGIDMIDAGLLRIPDDPSLYISRGSLYAQLAEYDKAESDFKTAERLNSSQSLSAYALDLTELSKNNPEKALSKVRLQLKAHTDSALLHYLLAKLLEKQGLDGDSTATREAINSASMAVKLKPDLVEARDLLASFYIGSGQYPLAIEQCQLALKFDPADQTALYHLIMALRHSGPSEQRDQIKALVKRLSELQQASLRQETDRHRFKLEVQKAAPVN